MKFENENGEQILILEKNDKIKIKTSGEFKSITLKSDGEKIDISGSSELVGSIKGLGMLEKMYIPPVVSSQDIIEKCDKWLEMFRKIHDRFKELVLKDEYRKQNITMDLSFPSFLSLNGDGRIIDLDLTQFNTILQDGVHISIDEANEDVYAYLVANVLDYYVSKNYVGTKINNMSMDFNGVLYSNEPKIDGSTVPMIAGLNSLMESFKLSRVVNGIIGVHNLGLSSKQIIDNLRNKISDQQIGDSIDFGISYTEQQIKYVINIDEEKSPVKKLTRNNGNK